MVISRIRHVNYNTISMPIISLILIMVFIFSGAPGLLIMFIGTCIGLLAILSGTRRTHLMGFLLLSTILYFSGISVFVLAATGL